MISDLYKEGDVSAILSNFQTLLFDNFKKINAPYIAKK